MALLEILSVIRSFVNFTVLDNTNITIEAGIFCLISLIWLL